MTALILSDLHLEFGSIDVGSQNCDIVILAGDTAPGLKGPAWARETFPHAEIVMVAGNHEYYRHALPKLTDELKVRAAELDIHYLENDEVTINGIRFLGCTLWTDFQLFGPANPAIAAAGAGLNDYKKIRVTPAYRKFRPDDAASLHARSCRWLKQCVEEGITNDAVIITHHAPSIRSVEPEGHDEPASVAYASHLDGLVESSRARLWIHGHTHYCVDYSIGETRVLSNQRGYVSDPVAGFNPTFTVDFLKPERFNA